MTIPIIFVASKNSLEDRKQVFSISAPPKASPRLQARQGKNFFAGNQ